MRLIQQQQMSTLTAMSSKPLIQNLQDCQLIRIFLDFVQRHHLQYQKLSKQISYKCYEATWILSSTKATGYGRTESQAYKHALRNLLEILVEDQQYGQFFASAMTGLGSAGSYTGFGASKQSQNRNKSTVSKPPLYSTNKYSESHTKTEANQCQQSQQQKSHSYEGYYYQPKTKYQSSSTHLNTSLTAKPDTQHSTQKHKLSDVYQYTQQSTSYTAHRNKYQQQLLQALARNKLLESELATLDRQNQQLLHQLQHCRSTYANTVKPMQDITNTYNKIQMYTQPHDSTYDAPCMSSTSTANNINGNNNKSKVLVPKLKLEILPNYHKKVQKSLNDSLLAVYEQKYGDLTRT